MIERVNLYCATCDRCKARFRTIAERNILEQKMRDEGWFIDKYGCMCPECRKKRSGL